MCKARLDGAQTGWLSRGALLRAQVTEAPEMSCSSQVQRKPFRAGAISNLCGGSSATTKILSASSPGQFVPPGGATRSSGPAIGASPAGSLVAVGLKFKILRYSIYSQYNPYRRAPGGEGFSFLLACFPFWGASSKPGFRKALGGLVSSAQALTR